LARRLRRGFCGGSAAGGSIGVGATGEAGPACEGTGTDTARLAGRAAISGGSTVDESALPATLSGTAARVGWSPPAGPVIAAGGTESSTAGVSAVSAGCGSVVVVGSSECMIAPPAPNSIILIAHSLHATRWRHGRRTTSRGELRHTRHSDDGSSSEGVGAEGGYVCTVGFGLAAGTVC